MQKNETRQDGMDLRKMRGKKTHDLTNYTHEKRKKQKQQQQ